jgi:hypothetical protein
MDRAQDGTSSGRPGGESAGVLPEGDGVVRIRKVGMYCGTRWYRLSDWKNYGFLRYRKLSPRAFSIGPILFWEGK